MSNFLFDLTDERDDHSVSREFEINRTVYNELQFSRKFLKPVKKESVQHKIRAYVSEIKITGSKLTQFIFSLLPVLRWLPKYSLKKDLVRDFAGGLTVGIMQVPQGMAYAMLTTLSPIYGLYVSFMPVLVYFIFGTSRHISIGTFAVVCLMNGEAIESMTNKYEASIALQGIGGNNSSNATAEATQDMIAAYRVEVAVSLACLVGLIQIFLGVIRLGFLTMYLSDPLVSGFTTGAAFHILSSQVRHFLGLTVPRGTNSGIFGLFKLYYYFLTHLKEVNVSSLIIGIICAILLYTLKYLNQKYKFRFPIPAELIVVILGAGASYGAKFNEIFDTPVLKSVPKGMPALTMPSFTMMGSMIAEGFTIAIVAFAINVSLVKSFAKKNNYETDSNQELIAYGLANSISSFFSCFPSAASLSRSLIQESLGSTQLTGLISVTLVLLVLLALAPLFQPLPNAVLAAIVLVALKGLFKQFAVLKHLCKISKIDAFVWFSSFLAVLCLGVDYGLAVGLIFTLLSVVGRTSRPLLLALGRIPGTEIYKRDDKYHVKEIPGVKILRYTASLYYANTEHFLNSLSQNITHADDGKIREENGNAREFSVEGIENKGVIQDWEDPKKQSFKMRNYETDRMRYPNGSSSQFHVSLKRSNSLPPSFTSYSVSNALDSPFYSEAIHSIILDCSLFNYIDTMGVSTLGSIVTDYRKSDIEVYLACCSENILSMLDVMGFMTTHGKQRIFLTVHDAVVHCLAGRVLKNSIPAASLAKCDSKDEVFDDTVCESDNADVKTTNESAESV